MLQRRQCPSRKSRCRPSQRTLSSDGKTEAQRDPGTCTCTDLREGLLPTHRDTPGRIPTRQGQGHQSPENKGMCLPAQNPTVRRSVGITSVHGQAVRVDLAREQRVPARQEDPSKKGRRGALLPEALAEKLETPPAPYYPTQTAPAPHACRRRRALDADARCPKHSCRRAFPTPAERRTPGPPWGPAHTCCRGQVVTGEDRRAVGCPPTSESHSQTFTPGATVPTGTRPSSCPWRREGRCLGRSEENRRLTEQGAPARWEASLRPGRSQPLGT